MYLCGGYSTQSRAYRVFNKRTRVIMGSIHVNFDELPHMASDHSISDPAHECQTMALEHDSLSPKIQRQANVPQTDRTVTMSNELDLLFSPMFDELLNGSSKVVSKSSAVCSANAPNQQTYAENDQVADDEFINIFCTPVQDQGETSSQQVIGNPSQSVRTRCQLESDAKMCMFALTVSRTEPKNIKEAMTDSDWIESLQEELHQFDRLDIHQSPRGIFINQAKYAHEILNKHASIPDIMHATCYCARYQAQPTEKHLTAVKRIFRYLKDTIHMGFWYPKDIGFELTAFLDLDHAGCLDSCKSTSGERFKYLIRRLGMRCLTPAELEALAKESA
nr:hypothetical protein [Tanacetum cinerariifolium]